MGEIADWEMEKAMTDIDDLEEHLAESIFDKSKKRSNRGYRRVHTTKTGQQILLSQMESSHLENFINLVVRKMHETKQSSMLEIELEEDAFYRELNGITKISKKDAVEVISALMEVLEPYLAEVVIRGNSQYVSEISQSLEAVLGRGRLRNKGVLPTRQIVAVKPLP